jgi:hypothetical protein
MNLTPHEPKYIMAAEHLGGKVSPSRDATDA